MRQVTIDDLKSKDSQGFEDLVAALVQHEEPDAEHLQAPDGGADILLEREGAGPKVWQVKRYPRDIHWEDCEKSLDSAVDNHGAVEVVFVFPRKMSATTKRTFRRRLIERRPNVEVSYWSGSHVLQLLRDVPALVEEFFDPDPKELRGTLAKEVVEELRAQVGPVGGFTDAAQERFALSDQAAKEDRHFRSEVTLMTGDVPDAAWKEEPYIVAVGELDDDRKLRVVSWPEEGKAVAPAEFSFTDDEAGRRAQRLARNGIARGEEVTLTSGVRLRVPRLPKAIQANIPEDPEVANQRLLLKPSFETEFQLRVRFDGETLERAFVMRGMPPGEDSPQGTTVSFGCIDGGVGLWLDVADDGQPSIAVRTRFMLVLGEDHATNAQAARLTRAFMAGESWVRAPGFLWDEWEPLGAKAPDLAEIAHAEMLMALFESVASIERARGVSLELPDEIEGREVQVATGVAEALRTGRGSVTIEMLALDMPTNDFQGFMQATSGTTRGRIPITAEVFGHRLDLGTGEVELPPPTLELPSPGEGGMTHVELRWTPPVSVPFWLVDNEPPPPRTALPIWVPGI